MVFFVRVSEKAVERQLREVNDILTMVHAEHEQEIELQHAWFRIFGMVRLVEEAIDELTAEEKNDLTKFTGYRRINLLLTTALREIETQMDQLHANKWEA